MGWLCTHVVNDRLSEDRRDGEEVGEEPTEQPRQEGPPWTSGRRATSPIAVCLLVQARSRLIPDDAFAMCKSGRLGVDQKFML